MFIFIKKLYINKFNHNPTVPKLNLNPSLSVFKTAEEFWNKNNCTLNSCNQNPKTLHHHFSQSAFLKNNICSSLFAKYIPENNLHLNPITPL